MVPASSNSAHADSPADHMSGHRGRMRAKLLDKGSEALSELELLEMLLYAGNRRGETEPSRADIDMTAELKTALSLVTITLHDHLIVAGKTVVSFKSLGLL